MKRFLLITPATHSFIVTVPLMGRQEAFSAVEAAQTALPLWKNKTAKQRAVILRRWFELIMQHQHDLAVILTSEQGKILEEAKGEIAYGASYN